MDTYTTLLLLLNNILLLLKTFACSDRLGVGEVIWTPHIASQEAWGVFLSSLPAADWLCLICSIMVGIVPWNWFNRTWFSFFPPARKLFKPAAHIVIASASLIVLSRVVSCLFVSVWFSVQNKFSFGLNCFYPELVSVKFMGYFWQSWKKKVVSEKHIKSVS